MSDQQPTSSDPIDAEFEPAETETPSEDETAASRKAPKSSGPGWLSLLFVMLVAFGALGLSLWSSGLLEKGLKPDETSTGLASLTDRQSDLSSRFDQLEQDMGAFGARLDKIEARLDETQTALAEASGPQPQSQPVPSSADISALQEQVTALEERLSDQQPSSSIDPQRIADLEAAVQASGNDDEGASSAEVAQLRQQLTGLRREVSQLNSAQSSLGNTVNQASERADSARSDALAASQMALAIASLETALSRGGSIEESAALLQSLPFSSSAVATISSLSSSPVASEDSLHQRFLDLRETALDRDSAAAGEPGWVNSLFGDYVSVRRGSAESETADRLATATAALDSGDLKSALSAVEELPDPSRAVYESWISDARQRIQLSSAVNALRLEFIEQTPR